MKKTKNQQVSAQKKLELHRESIRRLEARELRHVQGGLLDDSFALGGCTGDTAPDEI